MSPTTLILDFGGVLTTDLWESVRSCARREGLPADALLDLLRYDPRIHPAFEALERGEISQADFEQLLGAAAGIDPRRLLGRMCADLRPDRDMLDAVGKLRRTGVRIGILSNSWGAGPWRGGYFDPYDGYQLDQRADTVVLSDVLGIRKPDSAIFTHMLDRVGVPGGDCVFVDDVAANLPPAAALGMAVIHHIHTLDTLSQLAGLFAEAS